MFSIMVGAKPLFSVALSAALVLSGASLALGARQAEVPVSITAFDEATISALSEIEPVDVSFEPVAGPEAVNLAPEDLKLIGGRAAYLRTDPRLAELDSLEVLTGPQGTLFENPRIRLGNEPARSFYETSQVGTVVVAEVAGWPELSEEAIYELAVAFNYAGDEVLTNSPYSGDPLEGYGNVSSFGWLGSEPLVNYAKWQQGTWTQYADPLLRSEMNAVDGRLFVSWLLPGTPESIAINLSYAPERTIEGMLAQHVDVALPTEIWDLPLTVTYDALDPPLQARYESLFTGGEQTGVDQPVQPPNEEPPVADEPTADGETGASETGSQAGISDPNGDPDEDADAGALLAGEEGDEAGGLPIVVRVLIPIVGAAVAWLFYRWFVGSRKNEVAEVDDSPDPVELYDERNDPLIQAQNWNASVAAKHQGEGGVIAEGGWFAPSLGQVATPGAPPGGEPDEWTGYFLNANTYERVEMRDPLYAELLEVFGLTPPLEYNRTPSVPDGFVPGTHSGEASASESHAEETDEQPVIRSHPDAPSQVMTAREEALGFAEGMDGFVIDGWHRLPWEVGSDFFVKPDGGTYRMLPVANLEVLTDVNFVGAPSGFEPDAARYAYWMYEDGTLKVGSPDDPHAFPLDDQSPLEARLPLPAEGQSIMDVANERLIRAHELTDGNPPVDGWIAPSNHAQGAALLSDAFGGLGESPEAWSGHFFNVGTGEWVRATDPRYEQLAEQLGVSISPQPEPIEASEAIDMEGDVGPS